MLILPIARKCRALCSNPDAFGTSPVLFLPAHQDHMDRKMERIQTLVSWSEGGNTQPWRLDRRAWCADDTVARSRFNFEYGTKVRQTFLGAMRCEGRTSFMRPGFE